MMKQSSATEAIFGPCRMSYMNVFKPRKNDLKGGAEEFGAVLLIPKEPSEFCPQAKDLPRFVAGVIKAAYNSKFGEAPKKYDQPLKDGDKEENSEGDPKYPGFWYLRVSAKGEYPPVLIGGDRKPVTSGWESGDWGNVKVNFYGYDFQGKKGVSGGLRAIQFVAKDEPFGSSTDPNTVANEFDEVAGYKSPSAATDDENPDDYDPFE